MSILPSIEMGPHVSSFSHLYPPCFPLFSHRAPPPLELAERRCPSSLHSLCTLGGGASDETDTTSIIPSPSLVFVVTPHFAVAATRSTERTTVARASASPLSQNPVMQRDP